MNKKEGEVRRGRRCERNESRVRKKASEGKEKNGMPFVGFVRSDEEVIDVAVNSDQNKLD